MNDYSTIAGGYYGDKTRWFIGSVVSHTPPYGFEGRVKVRIHVFIHLKYLRYLTQTYLGPKLYYRPQKAVHPVLVERHNCYLVH